VGLLTMRDLAGFGDSGPPPGKETPLTQPDYLEWSRRKLSREMVASSPRGPLVAGETDGGLRVVGKREEESGGSRVEGEEEDELVRRDEGWVAPPGTPKWDYSRGSYYATSPEAVAKRAEEIRLRAAPAGSGDTPSVIASPFKAAVGLLSQLLTWITTAPVTVGEALTAQPGSDTGRTVSRFPGEVAASVTGSQTPTLSRTRKPQGIETPDVTELPGRFVDTLTSAFKADATRPGRRASATDTARAAGRGVAARDETSGTGIAASLAIEQYRQAGLRRKARLAADNDLAKAQADQRRVEDDRRRVEGERRVEAADQSAWTEAARISRPPQSVADLRASFASGAAALATVRDARRAQAKVDSDQYWAEAERKAEADTRLRIQDDQARQAIAAAAERQAAYDRRMREGDAEATRILDEAVRRNAAAAMRVASVVGGAAGTAVASGQRPLAVAAATGVPATGYAAFTARPPVYGSPPLPCPYGQRTPTGGCAGGPARGGGGVNRNTRLNVVGFGGFVAQQARDLHMGAF